MRNFILAFSLILVGCVVASPAMAVDATSFADPTGWNVGDAGTSYNEWDVLAVNSGNSPDVGSNYGSSTASTVYPGYVSGSSNFYSHASDYSANSRDGHAFGCIQFWNARDCPDCIHIGNDGCRDFRDAN